MVLPVLLGRSGRPGGLRARPRTALHAARAFSCRRPRPGPRPDRLGVLVESCACGLCGGTARSCDRCSVVPRASSPSRGSSSPRGVEGHGGIATWRKSANTPVICGWHHFAPPERPTDGTGQSGYPPEPDTGDGPARHRLRECGPPGRRAEGVGEVLRLVHHVPVGEFHDAHRVGGHAVVGDDALAHPQIPTAGDAAGR